MVNFILGAIIRIIYTKTTERNNKYGEIKFRLFIIQG